MCFEGLENVCFLNLWWVSLHIMLGTTDVDKLNLIKYFDFWPKTTAASATPNNIAHSKCGVKETKNNHLNSFSK